MIKPIRIAVYGSLKSGFALHSVLRGAQSKLLGVDRVSYFMLWDLNAYPCAIPTTNMADAISVEVYEVTPECLARLDATEGVDSFHYERVPIETRLGDAFIYQYHPESAAARLYQLQSARVVRSGNWTKPPISEVWSENAIRAALDPVYRSRVESCGMKWAPRPTNVIPFRDAGIKALAAPVKAPDPVEKTFDLGINFVEDTNHVDVSNPAV